MNSLIRENPTGTFSRWNPFREFQDMEKRLTSLLEPLLKTNGGERELLTAAKSASPGRR